MGDNVPQKCMLKLFGPSQRKPLKSSGDHKSSESTSKFLNFACLLHSMQGDERTEFTNEMAYLLPNESFKTHFCTNVYTIKDYYLALNFLFVRNFRVIFERNF